jgi:hypothetical protein
MAKHALLDLDLHLHLDSLAADTPTLPPLQRLQRLRLYYPSTPHLRRIYYAASAALYHGRTRLGPCALDGLILPFGHDFEPDNLSLNDPLHGKPLALMSSTN